MNHEVMAALALVLASGETDADSLTARAALTLGHRWRWLRPLAARYIKAHSGKTRPRLSDVVDFLYQDEKFQEAAKRHAAKLKVVERIAPPPAMLPVSSAADWRVPAITTVGDLARYLNLSLDELHPFAELGRHSRRDVLAPRSHYFYRLLDKSAGGVRLIEAPKTRLKQVQRRILDEILSRIPAHPAAHGFVKGRSIRTFASVHAGKRVVLKMDLQDFFPSISTARVQAFFRTVGYPELVADLLGGICTTSTPLRLFAPLAPALRLEARELYCRPHLPQGAPTSPALANLCAYRMDCRLAGFASSVGATYTRYADDLAFSGGDDFERCAHRLSPYIAAIAAEEGFRVHHRKTRVMRQSVRQQLVGLVANQRLNIRRADYDALKAILTNCARKGPADQNLGGHPHFRQHLEGRVAFVESVHRERGSKLRAIYEQIRWPDVLE